MFATLSVGTVKAFTRSDRLAYALVAAFFLFLLVFGAQYHTIEEMQSAEIDGFVPKADKILSGKLPRDVYRPLLYPLLSAGLGALLRDTFAGARVVSSLAAAILALAVYLLGRRCFGRGVGLFALAATVMNDVTIRHGLHTATDMTFAALALLTVLLAIRASDTGRLSSVVWLALSFALACFTRYTSVALLPAVAVSLAWTKGKTTRPRVALRCAVFMATAVVFLVPHFVLTARVFGSPLYDENWRNLAFKLYGGWDWSYLGGNPFDGLWSVIASSPRKFVWAAGRELAEFFYLTLSQLGGRGLAGALLAASTLSGLYITMLSLDRRRAIVLISGSCYVLLVCMLFFTSPRLMLPVLPLCYLLAGHFLLNCGAFAGSFRIGRLSADRRVPVVAVFLLALTVATAKELPIFVSMHPTGERAVAAMLGETYGDSITVAGTWPFCSRYVRYQYRYIRPEAVRVNDRFDMSALAAYLEKVSADYLMVGRLTLDGFPLALLEGRDLPPFLELVRRERDATVYRHIGNGRSDGE